MPRTLVTILMLASITIAACTASAQGAPSGHRVVVTEADNGSTITLHNGDTLLVKLHSTYWRLHQTDTTSVLKLDGHTVDVRRGHCPPGVGCGTVRATFNTESAGRAVVHASRQLCGEVIRCTNGNPSQYVVTVVVR
jgi:predicted secreted protein